MGTSAKAAANAIEVEAANEVQSWLECPAIREEFRRQVEAWEQAEQEQRRIDHDTQHAARHEQRPLGDGEFPLQFDGDGKPTRVSTAGLSNRWPPTAAFKLAADATAADPRPEVSGDLTHSLTPWSTASAFVLLAVLHDRTAAERGGRWQPIMAESDHWPTFAVRVLADELRVDDAPPPTSADRAFDAGDIRSAMSTVRDALVSKGLLAAIEVLGASSVGRILDGKAVGPPVDTKVPAVEDASNKPPSGKKMSVDARACAILVEHPDWTIRQIAENAGCHRGSLTHTRAPKFRAALEALRSDGLSRRPRGSRNNGRVDAWLQDE